MARDDTLKIPRSNFLGVPSHSTKGDQNRLVHEERGRTKCIRLVLALAPNEVPVELGVGVELLGEEAGLALLGLGVLFFRGQVEDQVSDDEGL